MIEVTLAGALIAGLLSFLSPCVLPLVPAYLSYISGVSVSELRQQDGHSALIRRRALLQSLWFVAGFSLVFIALGVSATLLGQWLMTHMNVLGKIAGAIIVTFGLHYTGLIRIPLLTGRVITWYCPAYSLFARAGYSVFTGSVGHGFLPALVTEFQSLSGSG